MRKAKFNVLSVVGSAPVVVAAGMTLLILGGLSGVKLMVEANPNLGKVRDDLVVQSFETFKTSTQALLEEVETLKSDTQSLMMHQAIIEKPDSAYTLLGYSRELEELPLLPRRDPFAPVSPPGQDELLVQQDIPIPAKVIVPGDG